MGKPVPNEKIPELTLRRPNGETVLFSQFLGKPVLLIFLRHLA
jgi:peroxiredoxin